MGLTLLCALVCAATANAAYYKMVLCAAGNGSTDYEVRNPTGAFRVENYCGPAGDPAGDAAFIRLSENQSGGMANNGDYVSVSWGTVPWVGIAAAGGYTREPGQFNAGWRGRFWAEGYGSASHILLQGTGVPNGEYGGIGAETTSAFSAHLWQFPVFADYRRFFFELTCMRPGGCDNSGWNGVDANSLVLILNDASPVDLHLTNTGSAPLSGQWVRGMQTATYVWSDQGSGIRMEWIDIDGARNFTIDHASECGTGYSPVNGEFALGFRPCSIASGIGRSDTINTAALSDGEHILRACAQDYGQYAGLFNSGGASCEQATMRTDNSPPGAPAGLEVTSANPGRYLPRVGARWQLPPNQGSPIAAVHYNVINAAGEAVSPVQTVGVIDPTSIQGIDLPKVPGAYRVKLWLEDSVGFNGPASTAPIPRDTTPPAAPQDLVATGPASWGPAQGYRLRWRNITDDGSPIIAAHYQVTDKAGSVVIATKTINGEAVQAVPDLDSPRQSQPYSARVWLEDEEGNVGAAASVALPRDTTPPAAPQDLSVAAPDTPRGTQGLDVRWRNVVDDGSPVVAAHYQVTDGSGKVVVPTETEAGAGVQAIPTLATAEPAGTFQLRVWLEDAEGNQGASATAPLSYECLRSARAGATGLRAGLGDNGSPNLVVKEGEGPTLTGRLEGAEGGGATLCIWSRVITDQKREFLGLAMTGADGRYRFPVGAGPSREFIAEYRGGQRELTATATARTVVRPTFRLKRKTIHNKQFGVFTGSIPGPRNSEVVVVLKAKDGKKSRVFRRYRTRPGGEFVMRYWFNRTKHPTTFEVQAEVPAQSGYPYEEGVSAPARLRVLP